MFQKAVRARIPRWRWHAHATHWVNCWRRPVTSSRPRKWLQSAVDVDEDSAWTDAAEVLDGLAMTRYDCLFVDLDGVVL